MRSRILFLVIALFGLTWGAEAQTTIIGNTSPNATNWSKGNLRVDSALTLPKYANSDTNYVLAVDGSGSVVRRLKGGGGLALDTTSLSNRINLKIGYADTPAIIPTKYGVDTAKRNIRTQIAALGLNAILNVGATTTVTANWVSGGNSAAIGTGGVSVASSSGQTNYGATGLSYQGLSGFSSVLGFNNPTASRTINFQDASGTVATLQDTGSGSGLGVLRTVAASNTAMATVPKLATDNSFTGKQVIILSGLGTTLSSAVRAVNGGASTSLVSQSSPALQWSGTGWNSTTSTSDSVSVYAKLTTASAPTSTFSSSQSLDFYRTVNNGAAVNFMNISSTGQIIANSITATTNTSAFASITAAGGTFSSFVQASYFNANSVRTSVAGSTSGTAVFSQPQQGTALKECIVTCNALLGTATYTFPTPFVATPSVRMTNGLATTLVTSLSTTSITVTGSTSTGDLFIDGR